MLNKKLITVKEALKIDSFDPMAVDTNEIKELSSLIPKDGLIDINNAEILATRFLRGEDLCNELFSMATAYVAKTETDKKKAFAEAALIKANNAGIKTDKSRAWYAESDPDYINACNKHTEAIAFLTWIKGKSECMAKSHYMMKKLLDRHYQGEQSAGWNGIIEDNKQEQVLNKSEEKIDINKW